MKAYKVCYVSSEVAPFAKTMRSRGLADTSKALPIALKETEQDIRLMMPKYKSINERKYVLREVIRLREVNLSLGDNTKSANGKTAFLPNSKVHVYFLSVPEYFDRKGFYKDPQTGKDQADNAERFAFFCKSVLETLKLLYWQPDIIHCSDWGTALIPYYLKTHYKDDEFFQDTRTILTIHNIAEQGIFPLKTAAKIGISDDAAGAGEAFELNGKLNLLKGGITHADIVNTVSEHFAKELLANPKSAANGLEDVVSSRKSDIHGVLSGIDYTAWDPETDENIPSQFDSKSLSKKKENKRELCRELDLNDDPSIPIVAMMADLSHDTDNNVVLDTLTDLVKKKVQLVIMGNGESKQNAGLAALAKANAGKVAFLERFDNRMSHVIIAGADMIFIPTETMSGGLSHLSNLRYGTVPIAYEVGVLADSIKPFDAESGKGTGFIFTDLKKTAIMRSINEALKVYQDEKIWAKIQKSGMRADFSWETTSKKYLKLYEKATRKN